MQIAPGLHRIGNDIVAAHLIVADDGITLVDAALPGHYRDLERELAIIGRPISDIRGIVLTHGDSDHIGFAERLRQQLAIEVYVGIEDASRAMGAKPPATTWGARRIGPLLGFLAYTMGKGGYRARPLSTVATINDGDVLDLPGRPRIVAMPGHSPGSIAIVAPTVRAVFVGDGLTTRSVLTGVTGPQPAPFTDDPAAASASLERLRNLDVDWIVPGHGAPFHGSPAALIEAYRTAERTSKGLAGWTS